MPCGSCGGGNSRMPSRDLYVFARCEQAAGWVGRQGGRGGGSHGGGGSGGSGYSSPCPAPLPPKGSRRTRPGAGAWAGGARAPTARSRRSPCQPAVPGQGGARSGHAGVRAGRGPGSRRAPAAWVPRPAALAAAPASAAHSTARPGRSQATQAPCSQAPAPRSARERWAGGQVVGRAGGLQGGRARGSHGTHPRQVALVEQQVVHLVSIDVCFGQDAVWFFPKVDQVRLVRLAAGQLPVVHEQQQQRRDLAVRVNHILQRHPQQRGARAALRGVARQAGSPGQAGGASGSRRTRADASERAPPRRQ